MTPQVEKWFETVRSELSRVGNPLPPEYILTLISRESNGNPGVVNPSRGDSGLMQVIPESLETYNNNHRDKYTIDQLRGKTQGSAAIQIRVGLWILSFYLKKVYKYLKSKLGAVPLDDLIKFTDASYASGWGNVKPKIDGAQSPTWDGVKSRYPNWGRITPAEKIWDTANNEGASWSLPSIDAWIEGTISDDTKKNIDGAVVGLLIILIAWAIFGRNK